MLISILVFLLFFMLNSETLKSLSEQNGVLSPYVTKNNTPKRNPSSHRFAYGSLVCRFLSTTDADISHYAYLPTLFTSVYPLTSFAS